jgi:hypothetical protein
VSRPDPYEAFEKDVPAHLREDAMQAMAEATGGYGAPSNVHLIEHDRIDAINCRAHGVITIEGVEYVFQMADGNHNGTELLSWDEDKPFGRHEPTRWALQPEPGLIDEALAGGRGQFLLAKWDIMIARPEVAEIVRSYAYDRYVQPGGLIEKHYRDKAAKHHFEIVTEETAQETRALLARSTTSAAMAAPVTPALAIDGAGTGAGG